MPKSNEHYLIHLRIDEESFSLIERLKKETGLSVREILGYSSKPCECCKGEEVVAYNSKDRSIKIKRGILFQSLLTKYGHYNKKNTAK